MVLSMSKISVAARQRKPFKLTSIIGSSPSFIERSTAQNCKEANFNHEFFPESTALEFFHRRGKGAVVGESADERDLNIRDVG
jgi:hypothetical protein